MKRFFILLVIPTFLFSIQASSQTIRDRIQERRIKKVEKEQDKSVAPDYNDLFFWAAHPQKKDMSDSIPVLLKGESADTLADVFFLHPTTYVKDIKGSMWNADLHDTAVNNQTARVMLMQASVFNNSCRVFAPRYRQAHIKAYLASKSGASQKAFDLAYEDLKNAFQYYLDHWNNGRPIIIASHSQGAMHAIRLLQEFFDGKPLQKKLVCAYIVGWQIKTTDFKELKVGETPDATNCFVGWRSYRKGETDFVVKRENGNSICVNPVSWNTLTELVPKEMHKAAMGMDSVKTCQHCLSTSIDPEHKVLWVDIPETGNEKISRMKNLHVLDYNLFYLDIRENVQLRVKKFFERNK
ncbi:MAG: DUF3089 domain-containing protein [Bacteroidota bacterium]